MDVPTAQREFFEGRVSLYTLYKNIREKKIPCVKIGRRILLDEDTLKTWWASQEGLSVQKSPQGEYGKIRRIL